MTVPSENIEKALIPEGKFLESTYLGKGRFQNIWYSRRLHPRLKLLYGLYFLALALDAAFTYWVSPLVGLGVMGLAVGAIAVLRRRVPKTFVRGEKIGDPQIVEHPHRQDVLSGDLSKSADQSGSSSAD